MGRWRTLVLLGIHIFIAVRVILWLRTGTAFTPIEPSESMAFVDRGVINVGLIFFALALLSTAIFGRWFCGWACHVVALQDASSWLLGKFGLRPKPFRSRLLIFVPLILACYMFVWPAVYRWGVAPISSRLHQSVDWIPDLTVPAFNPQLELTTNEFWRTFPGLMIAIPFFFVCGFACVYFLGAKGYCTYGCPYGGFFAPLDSFARGRIRADLDACDQTGHCTAVCTSNVRVHEEIQEHGMVVDVGCMKCMDCVSVCPNDALKYGFGKLPGKSVSRSQTKSSSASTRKYDLSLREEIAISIVFLVAFLSVRGAYTVIPMLMASGLAACITFIVWKAWRVFTTPNVAMHRFRLRYHGKLRLPGVVYVAGAALVALLTLHTGVVQAFVFLGNRADGRVLFPKALVFTQSPRVMPEAMQEDARRGLRWFDLAQPIGRGGIAFAPWPGIDNRRGWLKATLQDFDGARASFARAASDFGDSDGVASDIFVLDRIRFETAEGETRARATLAEHPSFLLLARSLSEWLISEGRTDEAIEVFRTSVAGIDAERAEARPKSARAEQLDMAFLDANRALSLALLDGGQVDRAIEVIEKTIAIDPDHVPARMFLARAYTQAGRMADALTAYTTADEMQPDNRELKLEVADLLRQMGRILEAEAWTEEADALLGGVAEQPE